ncbi:MAG TPA: hemerythrin domain-containing protein [Candidatus Limnocylindrales bacterium]
MDVLTLLKEDHDRVKRLLEEGDKTTERGEKTRTELFQRLKDMLTAHEAMEEEVLYPALKAHPKAKELTLEAYEEHHVVDMVLEELEMTPVGDEQWGAKFTVAKENIEHHIEEEEGEMFRNIRELFSTDEREAMAAKMAEIQALAKQVQQESAAAG